MSLQKTKNYSLFEVSNFNRDVKKTKKLEKSMKEHGFIEAYPLHVVKKGAKLEIKGGHHRFTVASDLGLAIPYVICTDTASIHEMEEATVKWSLNDYLVSFTRLEKAAYESVTSFHLRTGISVSMCVSMLGGELATSNNHNESFKKGEYKLSDDLTHAYQVSDLVKIIKDAGNSWALSASCVGSLSRVILGGKANFEIFKQKLKANVNSLENRRSSDGFMDLWEEVYNKKSRGGRIPLVFLTNEAIKERQLIFVSKSEKK